MIRHHLVLRLALCVAPATWLAACAGSNPGNPVPADNGTFESDLPNGASQSPGSGGAVGVDASATGGSTSSGGTTTAAPTTGEGSDAARTIEEADIVKIEDDRLYALSRYGGLSVIDIGTRDRLEPLGTHKIVATPFEMYVHSGVVTALYNGYADYAYDDAAKTWTYFQTSYVVVIDARDPANMVELSRFEIGGEISDSRIVGNVLYVAAYENGYCWGCGTAPRTNLISLDVSDPADVRRVDELSFDEDENYSWHRSLTSTENRLYVGGPEWGPDQPVGSTIQVIDISDPGGDMVLGAAVGVAGQISSRWQMDETDGVLRVISQPFSWNERSVPAVETFRVNSSSSIVPLASEDLLLPENESLQTVRFDGPRAYAITFRQTDPLFTIDLSDPARPRQVGELAMPGWLYYLEPRGDRVLGLGFDQGNQAGAITVSLFDVSDLATPSMLSRVNFGGDWGSLAEDQDRIQKAFNVMDDIGLILVPFSGWSSSTSTGGCYAGSYQSGIQLVDWSNDALSLGGIAPSIGQARRGLLHDGRLLAMSDDRVESFDIDDRGAPTKTADLPIARYVTHTTGVGDSVLRVTQNWWTNNEELDVTGVDAVGKPVALGSVMLPQKADDSCYASSWLSDVRANGNDAYLVYDYYSYDPNTETAAQGARIVTVNVSDPRAPAVAGEVSLEFTPTYYYGWYYGGGALGLVQSGTGTAALGSTLAFFSHSPTWNEGPIAAPGELHLVDLANPKAPVTRTLATPSALGYTGLVSSGNVIATSHYEAVGTSTSRVRFYLDRVVKQGKSSALLPPVNIPGSLVAFDAESSHAITADYHDLRFDGLTWEQCYSDYGSGRFETTVTPVNYEKTRGTCIVTQETLYLLAIDADRSTVVDRTQLAPGEWVSAVALGDDRLFVSLGRPYFYYYGYNDFGIGGGYGVSSFDDRSLSLVVLSGLSSGAFTSARLEIPAGDTWGYVPLVARGTSAALSTGFRGKLVVVNASDPEAPRVSREVELAGYVQDLDIVGDTAVASLGYDGAQAISLAE